MLWTRALPGSAAVIAALSVPGLSLGAGFLAEGQATDAAQGKDGDAAALHASPAIGSGPAHGEGAPQSLRAMLALRGPAAPSGRQNQVAEQAGPIAPLASPLLRAVPRKRVPEISAAPVAPAVARAVARAVAPPVALAVARAALAAVSALPPLAETVSAATATSAVLVPAAVLVVPAMLAANNAGS